jgi:carboxylesterase type B
VLFCIHGGQRPHCAGVHGEPRPVEEEPARYSNSAVDAAPGGADPGRHAPVLARARWPQFPSAPFRSRGAAYGAKAESLLALYRAHFPDKSPYLLYSHIITDAGFRRFAYAQAERKAAQARAPVFTYLWEWTSPAYDGKFGAVHAMDVAASLYDERDVIVGSGSRAARTMCDILAGAWVAFAKTGDPTHELIPHWPRFEPTRRSTLVFGDPPRVVDDPYAEIRAFWQDMPGPFSLFG